MFTQLTDNVAVYVSQGDGVKYGIVVDDLTIGFANTLNEAIEIMNDLARELEKDIKKELENVKVYTSQSEGKLSVMYSSLSYLSLGGTVTRHTLYVMPIPRCIVRMRMPSPRESVSNSSLNDDDLIKRLKRVSRYGTFSRP